MIQFDVITIFPESIKSFVKEGVFRIAQEKNLIKIRAFDLRTWTIDKHRSVDDHPYGGGAGMVMKIEPIDKAIRALRKTGTKVIVMTPRGKQVTQQDFKELSSIEGDQHYILIAGHYEGIDQRVYDSLVDYEYSVGDFVLSGGELPTLVFMDGITRLIPGVLGNSSSQEDESFQKGLLEYPQYTRPEVYDDMAVPPVLLTGNHEEIRKWREEEAMKITKTRRPDLVK